MSYSRHHPLRVAPTLVHQDVVLAADTKLALYHRGIKALEAFKLICSKYIFDRENFDENDRLALNLAIERFKHDESLGLQRELTSLQRIALDVFQKEINLDDPGLSNGFRTELNSLFYRTPSEYFGRLGQLPSNFKFQLKYTRRKVKRHFVKYIGVGYADKGSARNRSLDGSPTWQELATELTGKVIELCEKNNREIGTSSKFCEYRTFDSGRVDGFNRPIRFEFEKKLSENGLTYYVVAKNKYFSSPTWSEIESICKKHKWKFKPLLLNGIEGFIETESKSTKRSQRLSAKA